MKTYIGIDNGLDGGMAFLEEKRLQVFPLPVTKAGKGRKLDLLVIERLVRVESPNCFVLLEEPEPHAPAASALRSLWYGFGQLEALLTVLRVPFLPIKCRTWQREFFTRPQMAKGEKFDTKAAALVAAQRIWPRHDWRATERSLKFHDGMIDAALIAEFGRRNNL